MKLTRLWLVHEVIRPGLGEPLYALPRLDPLDATGDRRHERRLGSNDLTADIGTSCHLLSRQAALQGDVA